MALVWPVAAQQKPQQNSQPQTQPRSQSQDTAGQSDGPMTEDPRTQQSPPASIPLPRSEAPPLRSNESSSEQTRIDLSPPKADELAHPDEDHAADDVTGVHEWNPLRAKKDVEVGDFYYKKENYKAALSRFREALQYKPRDAVATFRLAQTLEKSKQFEEARAEYEAYLEILKDGPSAGEAKKALARLKKQ
jgi:tetratricopeptide (TPR) repeat protein